jgi:hypothetical protein
VDVKSWRMNAVRMEGKAFVGEKRVAEATVTCQLIARAGTQQTPNGTSIPPLQT